MEGKYSCGEINYQTQYLTKDAVFINILMMLIGLFLMCYGGVRFKTFMLIIAGLLTFLLIVLSLMSLFNIYLTKKIIAFFYSIGIIGSAIITYINKIYKQVVNGIIGYVGITYGLKITETFDPEVVIFQSILIMLLIKVLGIILFIYFKDFLVLVFNSFIGSCLFVIGLG